jgi:hypothetical protein
MTKRRNRRGAVVLLLASSLLVWLHWPGAEQRMVARIKQLGGRVLIQNDEDGREAQNVIFICRPLTDKDLNSVAGLSELKHLRLFLDNTKVTDAGLAALKEFADLRTLSLCNTGITDQGLQSLAECARLERLSLRYCPVTDKGLECLASLSCLRTLDVQETHVSAAGVARLQKAHPGLRIWHVVADDD